MQLPTPCHRQAEPEQFESNTLRKTVIDQLATHDLRCRNIGTWDWDVERDLVKCCGITASLFGICDDERETDIPLQRFVTAIHKADRKRFLALIEAACREGGVFMAEYRTHALDGRLRRTLARGSFELKPDGTAARGRGIVIDITDLRPTHPKSAQRSKVALGIEGEPLPLMADHIIMAWKIGQTLPSNMFAELKPAFRDLLYTLGIKIAADVHTVKRGKRSSLH